MRSGPFVRLMPGLVVASLLVAIGSVPSAAQRGELIERTLAIVGGQVITLSDVQTAMALGLVEPDHATSVNAATLRLVDRMLVLREVQRYLPPEPGEADIDSRLDAVRQRLGGADQLDSALMRGGFTETRLRSWLRDDARIAAYLGQRFAAVGVPSDEDVNAYYTAHREEFERKQQSVEAAAAAIRERLSTERRDQLIADWVQDLRRRTPVVELWKSSGVA
jgi:hypothetical protein